MHLIISCIFLIILVYLLYTCKSPCKRVQNTAMGVTLAAFSPGVLSFYNAKTKQLMHTFKTKFQQPVIPAFMVRIHFSECFFRNPQMFRHVLLLNHLIMCCPLQVWNGSFSVVTGLQVPSMVQSGQRKNSGTSSSNASLT